MTARDDEARLLNWARELADPDWCLSVPKPAKDAIRQLVAVIEAKPRTITTAEELDALTDGVLVLTEQGGYWESVKRMDGLNWWKEPGASKVSRSDDLTLPATVLYEPQP